MAIKKIYASSNYLMIEDIDQNGRIFPFPKTKCAFHKNAGGDIITTNYNTGAVHKILNADIGTWFEETGVTPYTESTLTTYLESNTGG